MKNPPTSIHPVLAALVIAMCVAASAFMFLLPSDSLAVDLVYQTF
jgi:uncharacterized membrane protein